VLNSKCLETGILSRDNPPYGFNTVHSQRTVFVSKELTQTEEFLKPKSIITLNLWFQRNEKCIIQFGIGGIQGTTGEYPPPCHVQDTVAPTGLPVCWWAYLQNFHEPASGTCDMDARCDGRP